jgi:membrane protein implicated in regulation of membrane protease activity
MRSADEKLWGGLLTAGIGALAFGAEYAYGPAALPFKAVASVVLVLLNLMLWWPELARFFTRRRR